MEAPPPRTDTPNRTDTPPGTDTPPRTGISKLFTRAFNLTLLQKSRLAWVDYLKGIAIVLVVYRHVLIGIQRSVATAQAQGSNIPDVPFWLEKANMIFFSFRMPLFFILSGIFISGSLAKRTLKQVIGIKFDNLLYPYFVWVFLQVTLQILLGSNTNSNRTLINYTYILYQPRALDQFWYLPALFNTTVIYLLVKTYLKPPVWGQFLIGLVLYFCSPIPAVHSISMISDWMEFYLFFALGDSIATFFFKESTQRFLKNPYTLVLITPVFFLTQVYYLAHITEPGKPDFLAIALIGCFSMFVLAFRMQIWNVLSFLRIVGYHSLYIYVTHVFVAGLVRLSLTKFLGIHNPYILLVSGIFFGVTIPIIFYNLLVLDGPLWFLFSFKKRQPRPTTPGGKISLT
ncbi:MAG TPA: acyltransferase [Puia sp.]|jgi:fucose 4-O-acetylase-like acetyltransferase|nr:acyltransferase [Puia sp.]